MAGEIAQRMRHFQQLINQLHILQSDQSRNDQLTEEYGLMKFDNDEIDSNSRLSYYIRLALNTSPDKIVRLLKDGCQLSSPNLIISITGGAKNCHMPYKLRKTFQQGLVQAAMTTNAWIITAGTNTGVVKEVGEAIDNYRYRINRECLDIPIIAFTNWNSIQGKEYLQNNPKQILNRSVHSINAIQMDVFDQYFLRSYVINEKEEEEEEEHYQLESHHSHILLFDDGELNANPSVVLSQRALFEKSLRFSSDSNEVIPLVLILLEGGSSAIKTICQALEENTPVLVIKDSGRAANILAELHQYFHQNDQNDDQLHILLSKIVEEYNWFEQVQDQLCQTLRRRLKLISIYQLNAEQNLEDAILQTLFNATKYSNDINEEQQHLAELKLAISWNRFDYATNHILNERNLIKWKENDLLKCLIWSILSDNVQFVHLLIENGALLEKLTYDHLNYIYSKTIKDSIIPLKNSNQFFFQSRDDFYQNYFQEKYSSIGEMISSSENHLYLGENGANRLFLWSLSVNRFHLAKYLSSKIWNPTIGCLLAAKFYQMASYSTIDLDKQKFFNKCYTDFDQRSSEIIDQCFNKEEDFALDIIKNPAYSFGDLDALQVAADGDCRLFLSSKSLQKFLDNKWFGHINYKTNYIQLKIFFSTLLIPLLPIFAFFLPFIQKHKKMVKSTRDKTKNTIPTRIDFVKNFDRNPSREDQVKWSEKFLYYYQSPIVRFYYYGIFFVLFLILYSYVLLIDYYPLTEELSIFKLPFGLSELILHIWLFTFIFEEVRQYLLLKSNDEYFSEVWNKIDLVGFILYLISLFSRFIPNENLYLLSKTTLCLSLILWYIRLFHYFAAYESLGPKLVMIYGTMKDLIFFVCFIMIFLFGFSVTCLSLLRTSKDIKWIYLDNGQLYNITIKHQTLHFQLIQDVINYGIWKVFGQVDPIEGNDLLSEIAYVLTILFVAIANILLLNVLIALFNVTIQNVEDRSYTLWRYQRFLIIKEFSLKSPIPPPFNIFYYLFLFFRYLIRCIRKCFLNIRERFSRDNRTINNPDVNEKLITNENIKLDQIRKNSSFKITDLMKYEYAIADYLFQNQMNNKK